MAHELNRKFSKEEIQMDNKYTQKCLTSLATKKMHIKTTERFRLFPVRMAIIKNTNHKCWWVWGKPGTLICCWWGECKLVQPLWKAVWRFLKKLKLELPYDSVLTLLDINLKECKSGYNRDTCTPMFIAALFTIAKLWKQYRWPTTDEWINKMWYIHTCLLYLSIYLTIIFLSI
jgi:hypothetical protein